VSKIIDAHAHYGTVSDTPFMSASFEKVLEVSRDAGIDASVFLGKVESAVDPDEPNRQRSNRNIDLILRINEEVLERVSREPRCYQCCLLNPLHQQSISQTQQVLREDKCIGVKVLPRYHGYDIDNLGDEVFSFLAEQNAPAIFHSMDNGYDDPLKLAYFAAKYPAVRICMAHLYSCGPPAAPKHACLLRTCSSRNLYVGLEHPFMTYYGIIEHTVNNICGSDRIMYGSDLPCHAPVTQITAIQHAGISEEDRESILFKNAERFFGMEL